MIVRTSARGLVAGATLALSLAACQGNIGSGSGLSIPQAPAPYQPGGPGQQQASRERVLEGAVYLNAASPLPDLPLPSVGGFGIDISLGTAPPAATPTPLPTPLVKPAKAKIPKRTPTVARRAYAVALAGPQDAPSASAAPVASSSPAPSGTPAVASSAPGSAAPAGVTHLSDVPSPGTSGLPATSSSGAPATTGSAKPANHHTHANLNSGPKVVTKTVAYPDDAPVAPTPEPTGAIQTFPMRQALVRGYIMPAADVPIYGLAAIKFFVPKSEMTLATRGYTIAVFTAAKKHRGKLLEYDTAPTVTGDGVVSTFTDDPIVFKKSIGYEIVLYADQGAATPVPVPSGYPPAGNNPFTTPVPSGYPQQVLPGQGQTPVPYGYTPAPYGYPTPSPTPTIFH